MNVSQESGIVKEELVNFLFDNGAIKVGNFKLSSGLNSSYYLDLRILQSYPLFFRKTISLLKSLIQSQIGHDGFDVVCSIPTSGTIFGSALSYEIFKPHSYLRKDFKSYGTQKRLEGVVKSGSRVIFIDDVITTGQSLLTGIESIENSEICGVFVVVNRGQGSDKVFADRGIKLYSAIKISEIVTILLKSERISINEFQRITNELD